MAPRSTATLTPAAPKPARRPRPWSALMSQVAAERVNRVVFVVALIAVGFGDSILLPFDFTQRISFANWHYFDARYLAFTGAFAVAVAWVLGNRHGENVDARLQPCLPTWATETLRRDRNPS